MASIALIVTAAAAAGDADVAAIVALDQVGQDKTMFEFDIGIAMGLMSQGLLISQSL